MEIKRPDLVYNHRVLINAREKPQLQMKHSHNTYEIIFFESGDVDYVMEGRRYRLRKNDLVLTRPYTYHYIEVRSSSEYSRFNVAFDESVIGSELIAKLPEGIEVINCSEAGVITENFKRMERYSREFCEEDFLELLKGLLREIVYNLSTVDGDLMHIPEEVSPIVSRALEYIADNLFRVESISEICEALSLSEPYFFKLFKKQLKISPKQYINLKRLQYARDLIRRGRRPSELYLECGFETYVGFYKQYVKTFGHPPSAECATQKDNA